MTTKASASKAAAKKKILTQIAVAQKHADAAKKTAKAAKSAARLAKKKLKDAKRHAKKLRKVVKVLRGELAALTVKRVRAKPTVHKAAGKPAQPITPPAAAPLLQEVPPASENVPPADPAILV